MKNLMAIFLSLTYCGKENIWLATEQQCERINNMELVHVQEIQNCWCKWEKYYPSEGLTTFRLDKSERPCEMTSTRGNCRIA